MNVVDFAFLFFKHFVDYKLNRSSCNGFFTLFYSVDNELIAFN